MTERMIQKAIFAHFQRKMMLTNFTPLGWWECDVWSLLNSGYTEECEIKVSVADIKSDFEKNGRRYTPGAPMGVDRLKHDVIAEGGAGSPNRFYFVVPQTLAEDAAKLLPKHAGLRIVITETGFKRGMQRFHRGQIVELKQAPMLHKNKITNDQFRHAAFTSNRRWRFMKFGRDKEHLRYRIREKSSLDNITSRQIDMILEMI